MLCQKFIRTHKVLIAADKQYRHIKMQIVPEIMWQHCLICTWEQLRISMHHCHFFTESQKRRGQQWFDWESSAVFCDILCTKHGKSLQGVHKRRSHLRRIRNRIFKGVYLFDIRRSVFYHFSEPLAGIMQTINIMDKLTDTNIVWDRFTMSLGIFRTDQTSPWKSHEDDFLKIIYSVQICDNSINISHIVLKCAGLRNCSSIAFVCKIGLASISLIPIDHCKMMFPFWLHDMAQSSHRTTGTTMKKQHQRSFFISTSDLNVLPDTIDLRCLIQTYALFGIALQNFLFTAHLYLLPQVMTSDIDCVY